MCHKFSTESGGSVDKALSISRSLSDSNLDLIELRQSIDLLQRTPDRESVVSLRRSYMIDSPDPSSTELSRIQIQLNEILEKTQEILTNQKSQETTTITDTSIFTESVVGRTLQRFSDGLIRDIKENNWDTLKPLKGQNVFDNQLFEKFQMDDDNKLIMVNYLNSVREMTSDLPVKVESLVTSLASYYLKNDETFKVLVKGHLNDINLPDIGKVSFHNFTNLAVFFIQYNAGVKFSEIANMLELLSIQEEEPLKVVEPEIDGNLTNTENNKYLNENTDVKNNIDNSLDNNKENAEKESSFLSSTLKNCSKLINIYGPKIALGAGAAAAVWLFNNPDYLTNIIDTLKGLAVSNTPQEQQAITDNNTTIVTETPPKLSDRGKRLIAITKGLYITVTRFIVKNFTE